MMKPPKVDDYKLLGGFQAVRNLLLQPDCEDRLDKPLGYWAVPTDRRLPMAFLNRPLREIIDSTLPDLYATPGVGKKKILSLIKLLHRAAVEAPPNHDLEGVIEDEPKPAESAEFDPATVSEVTWSMWRTNVRRFNFGELTMGYLAPSLQDMAGVIWDTPLQFYLDKSLAEIRQLRTHGEKRVNSVLEVVHTLNLLLGDATPKGHLVLRLCPQNMWPIENWVRRLMTSEEAFTLEELRTNMLKPLIAQMTIDGGEHLANLVESRIDIEKETPSVREQSKLLGVTRARVYQLFNEVSRMVATRWPEGQCMLGQILNHQKQYGNDEKCIAMINDTRMLFFPSREEQNTRDAEAASE